MQVYTFYSRLSIPGVLGPLKVFKNHRDQMAVLKLWERTWKRQGWEPVVLGQDDALRADEALSRQIMEAQHLYRSPNPKQYEMACYLRWVAMLGVTSDTRAGLMTDYDVMNRSFCPDNLTTIVRDKPAGQAAFLAGGVPCAVAGVRDDFVALIELFLAFERHPDGRGASTRQSVSDQNILGDHRADLFVVPDAPCDHYRGARWESAPMVHFPHDHLPHHRAQGIARVFPV